MLLNKTINPLDEGILNDDLNEINEINKIIEDNKPKQTRKVIIKEFKLCILCNETKKIEEFMYFSDFSIFLLDLKKISSSNCL